MQLVYVILQKIGLKIDLAWFEKIKQFLLLKNNKQKKIKTYWFFSFVGTKNLNSTTIYLKISPKQTQHMMDTVHSKD